MDPDTLVTLGASAIEAAGSAANRIRWTLTAQQRTDLQSLDDGTRFILFITEPEAVATAHTVDAGDAAWAFDVPEVTVTVTHAYEVDAGDASWAFAVPEVAVTHVSAQPQAFTRNAGDVAWAFDVPEVTVTHTAAQPQDYTVDAGDVSWSLHDPAGDRPATYRRGPRLQSGPGHQRGRRGRVPAPGHAWDRHLAGGRVHARP